MWRVWGAMQQAFLEDQPLHRTICGGHILVQALWSNFMWKPSPPGKRICSKKFLPRCYCKLCPPPPPTHTHTHTTTTQHLCEKLEADKSKRQAFSREDLLKQAAEQENLRIQELEDKKAQSEAKVSRFCACHTICWPNLFKMQAKIHHIVKSRRKVLASKSTHMANFIQRLGLQDGPNQRELLGLYPQASRINLRLWNEYDCPTGECTHVEMMLFNIQKIA